MSTRIEDLDPRMRPAAIKLCRRCVEEETPVAVCETRRALAVHVAYHARGRVEPISWIQTIFARLGLWTLSDREARTVCTETLYSKHLDGLAMDIAPAKDGKAWDDAPQKVWEKIWRIAEDECGLDACAFGKWNRWLKDGRPWDLRHIEWRG